MATFNIKRGDTSPILEQTLQDSAGVAVSLVGATARMHVFTRRGVSVVDSAATISDASGGVIQYTFGAIVAGNYNYEVEVTFSDSSIETFPNVGYNLIVVEADLV